MLAAHVNAYKYFGGVTKIVQCDNLKTGVVKNSKDEVTINKSHQEMAEHYVTAILPARPRKPKDKAFVEGTVGAISRYIIAFLRNQEFLSISELNEAIWDKLYEFNHKDFQKREGSRATAFENEKVFLFPLPPRPFELTTWKTATVDPNYHKKCFTMVCVSVHIHVCMADGISTVHWKTICLKATRKGWSKAHRKCRPPACRSEYCRTISQVR